MDFNENIKILRSTYNLTQKEFADRLGVSIPTVAAWENGTKKPSFDVLVQIANTFDVSLDWLCGRNQKKEIPITTWTDLLKIVYSLLKYQHLDIQTSPLQNNDDDCTLIFSRYLLEPEYFGADKDKVVRFEPVSYGKVKQAEFDYSTKGLHSDLRDWYFESPVYLFVKEYSKMVELTRNNNDYQELFDLWLEKQFEKNNRPIWCEYNVND